MTRRVVRSTSGRDAVGCCRYSSPELPALRQASTCALWTRTFPVTTPDARAKSSWVWTVRGAGVCVAPTTCCTATSREWLITTFC